MDFQTLFLEFVLTDVLSCSLLSSSDSDGQGSPSRSILIGSRTPSPVASASVVPAVPRMTGDDLPDLPDSSHRPDTVAYRLEQLDEFDRLLQAEQERDGISLSETAPHLTWNSFRPLDFRPLEALRPWLWSKRRTRNIRYHDELEWPENNFVGRHLEGIVRRARVFKSPLNLRELIHNPNAVVHCTAEEAKLVTPSLYPLSPHESIQIVDDQNQQLFVYMRNGLKEAWNHPQPTHPDCT